ncbi:hypothetical protein ACJ73_01965 [Blastomyces percursus]|uniref:Uncharacterized protein n=1 Tax=Blastomyces percursus TaxID=1658174 RepID=A0A1J9QEW5_9EURO|nr:hypothetical protein ACJ73_01965 [Blastomyces percursus]
MTSPLYLILTQHTQIQIVQLRNLSKKIFRLRAESSSDKKRARVNAMQAPDLIFPSPGHDSLRPNVRFT